MRSRLASCLREIMANDERVVLLLAGVGGYSFRDLDMERVFDLDVREQAIVGMAAGLSMEGMLPVIFTIAPFLVERALEQIKVDICAQKLKAILISIGASYDYAAEGLTHHCPEDISILMNMPDLHLVVPGTADEFEFMLRYACEKKNKAAYYFRLSKPAEAEGGWCMKVDDPQAFVLTVGPANELACAALGEVRRLNYLNICEVNPLDEVAIRALLCPRVLTIEPYYPVLPQEIMRLAEYPVKVEAVGLQRRFVYGAHTTKQLYEESGMSVEGIRQAYERLVA